MNYAFLSQIFQSQKHIVDVSLNVFLLKFALLPQQDFEVIFLAQFHHDVIIVLAFEDSIALGDVGMVDVGDEFNLLIQQVHQSTFLDFCKVDNLNRNSLLLGGIDTSVDITKFALPDHVLVAVEIVTHFLHLGF